jgi:hypothetical protein
MSDPRQRARREAVFRVPVRFLADDAFRLRVLAAFFPAATRFGDFLVVVRAVRFRVVEAFRAAAFRFRVVAAFFPAATRFGDFLVVVRDAVRFRVVAAFLTAVVRFLVAAGFRAAVGVLVREVAGRVIASSIGPAIPLGMPSDRGLGRSHAGVSGRHEGSGALGASREPPSSTSFASSALSDARSSSQGRSGVVRSSDDGMTASSARGSPVPVPEPDPIDASGDVPVRRGSGR